MGASGSRLSLKLMVNKETNKVLFAEAGKDFVDVLISFLTLPLGTIAKLVAKEFDMEPLKIGSLSSLYQSVANLDEECMWTDTCKEMLLQPRNPMEDYCRSLKPNVDDTEPTKYYVCNNLLECRRNSSVMCSTFKNKECSCGKLLAHQISPKICHALDGFVKNNSCFLITDDLKVVPKSFDSVFCMIKNLGIVNMSSVEEVSVNVTENQVMDLLKCSLVSKTTLTDVFLGKKLCVKKYKLARLSPNVFAAEGCTQVNVKIMYQKSDGKIVCAQGKEDFANFLLSILTFPLGAVGRLLKGCSSMGSVDGLYKSVVDLNQEFFKTKDVKYKLVHLGLAPQFKLSNQILPICESVAPKLHFCLTGSYNSRGRVIQLRDFYLTSEYRSICDYIDGTCNALDMVDPISKNGSSKGFVKGPTMFVATDDLALAPMSSVSVISLINNMNTPFSEVEEKVVSIGVKEGLSILKASLTSTSALTNGLAHLLTKVKEEAHVLTKVKEEK